MDQMRDIRIFCIDNCVEDRNSIGGSLGYYRIENSDWKLRGSLRERKMMLFRMNVPLGWYILYVWSILMG
ncbi:MAG: hypothetical protein HDR28_06300 [Lachnospiraceae bacterium]|nr:hypothetical protein [Lachnospiraceae bacterium]